MKRFLAIFCLTAFLACVSFTSAEEEVPPLNISPLPILTPADFEIWAAPDGSDTAEGTTDKPLQTFRGAVDAVLKIRQANPEASVTVYFKGGQYPATETVSINNLNASAEKPILFRAAPGEKPVFTGGKTVSGWKKLTESGVYQTADEAYKKRFAPNALAQIYAAPLDELKIENYGDPSSYGKRMEFFVEDRPQTLARWPNEGFAVAGEAKGRTPHQGHPEMGCVEGIFESAPGQTAAWNDEPEVFLLGYWFWDWAESIKKLDRIDPESGVIYLLPPHTGYGFKHHLRYYGFNLLCELDTPGEYYIDNAKRVIYWIPQDAFVNPEELKTRLSIFDQPHFLAVTDSSHLIFAGLTWEEGRDSAISITGGHDILVADNFIQRFGKDAIHINGGKNHGVYHSTLETLGYGGITISGGDRKTLVPANHFVENSIIRDFSRIKRTYAPAILANGCGMRFAHNDFSISPSSAMRLEGNDYLVEFCRFHNVVQESDDQGGIDVYYNPSYRGNVIRWNEWENIVGGTNCGSAAIRFDDMISGYRVYGNVFIHCGGVHFGAIQIHGGKDNLVENNVFLATRAAVSCSPWQKRYTEAILGTSEIDQEIQNKIYKDVDIRSDIWQKRYPQLANIAEDPDVNFIQNNLIINPQDPFLNAKYNKFKNNSVVTMETPSLDLILTPEFLEGFGLAPIPFDQIGLTGEPFLK